MPDIVKPYERTRVQTKVKGKSRAIQSAKEECDINNILAKYKKSGIITHVKDHGPQYADLPDGVDFQTSMNMVVQAQQLFDSLPSSIRARFGNSPAAYLDFVADPANEAELQEMGVLERPEGAPEPYQGPEGSAPTEEAPELALEPATAE